MATKVTVRSKSITKGRETLYLDFYPPIINSKTGKKSRREHLGLYVITKPKNALEKQDNKQTRQFAEQIRQKRENELNKPEIYTAFEKEQLRLKELGNKCFVNYCKTLAEKRDGANYKAWLSALNYLEDFTGGTLKFVDLNEQFLENYKEYLLTAKSKRSSKTKLSKSSAHSYYNKIKASLKSAYKEGILQTDLNAKVDPIKEPEVRREFLTLEELNSLIKTDCNNPLMKKAALFSALTGLRFSDIKALTWKKIGHIDQQGWVVYFNQEKTNGVEYHPISQQARDLIGEAQDENEKVFLGLKYSAYHNKHLYQWIGAAGITKDITFHCFRHTYATLQLFNGTDLYTVSKLLGHKNIKTTQVYAKITNQRKFEAAERIKLDF
ncbi:tyrosine-type recombinase/integrase [Spongiimicrobium salis]|uniref:tyrosine-type recombinase/integrase n=1 Tax=Spongiimicrobium salis TaxID=1667022 RepID=UPI00374CA89F